MIPSFIQFLDIYLEERQQAATFKLGSWKVLQTWATHLKAFSSAQRRPLQYEDINTQFLIPFKNWLCDPQRNLSDNYIVKGVKVLKQFMQYINVNQKSNATQFANMVKGMSEG